MDVRSSFQRMKEAPVLSFLWQVTDAQVLWTGAHTVAALGTVLGKGRGSVGQGGRQVRGSQRARAAGEKGCGPLGVLSLACSYLLSSRGLRWSCPESPTSHPVPPWSLVNGWRDLTN